MSSLLLLCISMDDTAASFVSTLHYYINLCMLMRTLYIEDVLNCPWQRRTPFSLNKLGKQNNSNSNNNKHRNMRNVYVANFPFTARCIAVSTECYVLSVRLLPTVRRFFRLSNGTQQCFLRRQEGREENELPEKK